MSLIKVQLFGILKFKRDSTLYLPVEEFKLKIKSMLKEFKTVRRVKAL